MVTRLHIPSRTVAPSIRPPPTHDDISSYEISKVRSVELDCTDNSWPGPRYIALSFDNATNVELVGTAMPAAMKALSSIIPPIELMSTEILWVVVGLGLATSIEFTLTTLSLNVLGFDIIETLLTFANLYVREDPVI
jgi:hypothetical protein